MKMKANLCEGITSQEVEHQFYFFNEKNEVIFPYYSVYYYEEKGREFEIKLRGGTIHGIVDHSGKVLEYEFWRNSQVTAKTHKPIYTKDYATNA